jgi:hypothetical protein
MDDAQFTAMETLKCPIIALINLILMKNRCTRAVAGLWGPLALLKQFISTVKVLFIVLSLAAASMLPINRIIEVKSCTYPPGLRDPALRGNRSVYIYYKQLSTAQGWPCYVDRRLQENRGIQPGNNMPNGWKFCVWDGANAAFPGCGRDYPGTI